MFDFFIPEITDELIILPPKPNAFQVCVEDPQRIISDPDIREQENVATFFLKCTACCRTIGYLLNVAIPQ